MGGEEEGRKGEGEGSGKVRIRMRVRVVYWVSNVHGVRGFAFVCSSSGWQASYKVLVQASNIEWRCLN